MATTQRQQRQQNPKSETSREQNFRTPPHSLEAERALLGSVLLDNSALDMIIEAGLGQEDFYSEAHKIIFQRMVDISERQRKIDLVTLGDEIKSDGLTEKSGGFAYHAALTDGVPIGTTSAVGEYCRIVKDKSTKRRVIMASQNIITRCLEDADDAAALVDIGQAQFFELGEKQTSTGFMSVREVAKISFGKIDALFERGQVITGIETGLVDFDSMTCGLQPGELIIIAARPSLGKSAWALNIASNASIKHGKIVGFFSLEMSKEALIIRLLCSEARMDSHKLRTGFANREDWNRMTPALGRLSEAPLFIDDTPALSISQIRSKARRLKAEKGLDLLIVDYLQLVSGQGKFENRVQEVSYISRNLKAIAKELKIPVVALSQLNRAPEMRKGIGQRPQLSDLRESGQIEADADMVVFIFRKKVSDDQSQYDYVDAGYETLLIIGKQRNGPTGDVPTVFLKAYGRFDNAIRNSDFNYDGKAQAAND